VRLITIIHDSFINQASCDIKLTVQKYYTIEKKRKILSGLRHLKLLIRNPKQVLICRYANTDQRVALSTTFLKMGIYTALIATPILVVGVIFGSPFILSFVGLSAIGPVAGGTFAVMQGSAIAIGSWMAAAQAIAMAVGTVAISPTP
jgi:hypothetical protein